ncbi:MAG: DNA-protecting protein DprA [Actinobacteria bacterium]|nr:DNA-protecting protein DprA [Actinomycetota bacterium]
MSTGDTDPWEEVAADGTDPELLARTVGRLTLPDGDPRSLAKEAVERHLRPELGEGPAQASPEEPTSLLRAIAPPLDAGGFRRAAAAATEWRRLDVTAALVGDPTYPRRLAEGWPATGAPPLLAWRGPAEGLPDRPAVAIVGARRASPYGTGVAAWLASAAADAGALVVSGGAVGIDAAAHGAAVDTPGGTVAVLGCGHGVSYPRVHARRDGLFADILRSGGWLLSELPPDAEPRPFRVLARNRLVAGLADVVVVVEGGPRSGSLRTATAALDRGVPVMAVPGDVRAPGSAAPHALLADGAAPCREPADLLEALRVVAPHPDDGGGAADALGVLPPPVRAELAERWPRPIRLDDLATAAEVPTARLLGLLTKARIAGEVAQSAEGIRLTRAPDRASR